MRAVNAQGDELELIDGEWKPVAKGGSSKNEPPKGPRQNLLSSESKLGQFAEGALVSAGDQFATMGRNARDVYAMIRGDQQARLDIEDERAEAAQIRGMLHEDAPIGSMVGAMLPTAPLALLSGGTSAAGTLGAMRTVGTAAAQNAALGALGSESGDYGTDALIGGGMSLGMSAAGNIVQRVRAGRAAMQASGAAGGRAGLQAAAGLDEGTLDVLNGAKRAGMQLTPAQETGNLTYGKIEASMKANPFLSKFFDDIETGNKAQLNRLAARAMGQEADSLSAGVLMNAEQAIGEKFNEVGKRLGRVDLDPLIAEVETMAKTEAMRGSPRMEIQGILHNLKGGQTERVAQLGADEGRFISGQEMMDMRSVLSSKMRTAYGQGNHVKGQLYGEILEKYDDAIGDAAARMAERGGKVGAGAVADYVQDLYSTARGQWNAYRAAIQGGASSDGQVMPAAMARLMKGGDKSGYQGRVAEDGTRLLNRGSGVVGENPTGDLYDALRFATSSAAKPKLPPTGATNNFNSWLNSGGTVPSIARGTLSLGSRPLMAAYASQSPLASQAMMFMDQALKGGFPMGGNMFQAAQQAARMGQPAAGSIAGGFSGIGGNLPTGE